MIYPPHSFAGQEVSICNRYLELFRREHNEKLDGVLFRSLRLGLDSVMPTEYHNMRLIWLVFNWGDALKGNDKLGFPGLPEDKRVEATNRMNEALIVLKRFQSYQRGEFKATNNRLFKEIYNAKVECKTDERWHPTKTDILLVNGEKRLNVPSKNPRNEASNMAFAERFLHINADASYEDREAAFVAITEAKNNAYNSDHWDDHLDMENVRLDGQTPEPPDPFENYLAYIEDDIPGKLTVAINTATFANARRDERILLYDDKGAGHFSGDYEHLITGEITTAQNGGAMAVWALANVINDQKGIIDTSEDSHLILFNRTGSGQNRLTLREINNGVNTQDFFVYSNNVPYYMTPDRDEAIGVNGQLRDKIYSDVDRTSLLDTLLVLLNDKIDFQFVYGAQSFNDGNTFSIDGYGENLDLQEIAGFQAAWARNANQIIGMPQ